jgi:HEAT repeat protein
MTVSDHNSDDQMPRQSGMSVGRLFGIPALITLIAVFIYLFFGWLVQERQDVSQYIQDVQTEEGQRKWQAAFDLARLLQAEESLSSSQVEALSEALSKADEEQLEKYLAIALGRAGSTKSAPVARRALLDTIQETNQSNDVLITSVWALAQLMKDAEKEGMPLEIRSEKQSFEKLLLSEDPGVRKMVVYAMGYLDWKSSKDAIVPLLDDTDLEVRANAAIALARMGSEESRGLLGQILQLEKNQKDHPIMQLDEPTRELLKVSAVKAVRHLPGGSFRTQLEVLSEEAKSLRVRNEALRLLEAER